MHLAVVASHPVQYYAPLFRRLAQQIDLTVFYGHKASRAEQSKAGFGVPFDWDTDLTTGYQHSFLRNVAALPTAARFAGVDTPEIGRRLKNGSFDAVILMGWYLKTFFQALVAAKRLKLPVLVRGDSQLQTPRSLVKRGIKSAIYPMFLRQFDAALIVGERNRQYWRHYGYPESRMFESPHCVDTDWFAARATLEARHRLRDLWKPAPEAFVVSFAGKLVPFKRPLDLVQAAELCRKNGLPVEVAIAGDGPLQQAVREQAGGRKVPLHMLGFCNQTQMPEVYSACDAVVLPSTGRETWGLVVNEALACGRPVIVSDAVGSAPDMLAQLGEETIYPSGSVPELADRLRAAIVEPPDAERLQRASAAFSLDAAAAGIARAAQHVAGLRRRS